MNIIVLYRLSTVVVVLVSFRLEGIYLLCFDLLFLCYSTLLNLTAVKIFCGGAYHIVVKHLCLGGIRNSGSEGIAGFIRMPVIFYQFRSRRGYGC